MSEMKSILLNLRSQGFVGKFIGELLTKVSRDKGPKWVADKWDQSGLLLNNLIDTELENADKIIKEYVSICKRISFHKIPSRYLMKDCLHKSYCTFE